MKTFKLYQQSTISKQSKQSPVAPNRDPDTVNARPTGAAK